MRKALSMPEINTPQSTGADSCSRLGSPAALKPLLTTHDWSEEWKQLQRARRHIDSASHWDKRSATYTTKDVPNPYVQRFLELARIRPQETVFDMGCGTGALSIPLGEQGHRVTAADFSQGMLARLQDSLDKRAITTVSTKHMSWEDDWAAHGIRPDMADVCIASRSVATADLKDSLLRLTDVARRRVCITLATGSSPRTDERILNAIGLQSVLGRDYLYAFAILANEGLMPEVSYIDSTRTDTFDDADEAYDTFARMVDDSTGAFISQAQLADACTRLRTWLADNLVQNERSGKPDKKGVPEKRLRLREPRVITWAFIAWDK